MKKVDLDMLEDIPQPILDECLKGKSNLIIFVGAGLSCLCGYPTWDELANTILEKCHVTDDSVTMSDIEVVKEKYDAIAKISYADAISDNVKQLIRKSLSKKIKGKYCKKRDRILDCLNAFKAGIVTTNADKILDELQNKYLDWKVYNELNSESTNYIKNCPAVVHMHGSIDNLDSLVFTILDYAEKYSYKSGFGKNLYELFSNDSNKVILFIGYSLREFQMLQYILDLSKEGNKNRHIYKIDGYLNCENYRKKVDTKYYKKLGIELITYSKEEKGFDRLIDLLEKWKLQIEEQVNNAFIADRKAEEFLKNKPTKTSKAYLSMNFNLISDESFFTSNLIKSKYFKQWMHFLEKTDYFDAKKHFKPCIESEVGKYSSSYWDGLDAIEAYFEKYGYDEFIKRIAKIVLKQSAKILNDDKHIKDKYKRINTSFSIMHHLLDIMLSNAVFLENQTVVKSLFNGFIKTPFRNLNSLCVILKQHSNILIESNPRSVFYMYETLVKNLGDSFDYTDYYKFKNMDLIIARNPKQYFDLAEKLLKNDRLGFYQMGSFFDYDSLELNHTKRVLSCYYLKSSSKYLDKDYLFEKIISLLNSGDKYLMRVGLCLINVNIDRTMPLLKNYLNTFFSNKTFYSDLKSLLDLNSLTIRNKDKKLFDEIIDKVNSLRLEDNNGSNKILAKGLLNIIKKNCPSIIEADTSLSEEENKYILHYNQAIYSESIDFNGIKEEFYNAIREIQIEKFPSFISTKFANLSSFYDTALFEAIDIYLSAHSFKEYFPFLRNIRNNYFNHFINLVCSGNLIALKPKQLCVLLSSLCNDEYRANIFTLLRIFQNTVNDKTIPLSDKKEIIKNFKPEFIMLSQDNIGADPLKPDINVTHANYFYQSITMLLNSLNNKVIGRESFLKYYEFFKEKFMTSDCFKFDIRMLFGLLLLVDKEYFTKEASTYFRNDPLDFVALGYASYINNVLPLVVKNGSFKEFVIESKYECDPRNSICATIIENYIESGKYCQITKSIAKTGNINAVEKVYESLWHHLGHNLSEEQVKRFDDITNIFMTSSIFKNEEIMVDRLMYVVAQLILFSNNSSKILWVLLINLSKHKKEFFFDEVSEAIIKYCLEEKDAIKNIIANTSSSYFNYGVNYSTSEFIELLNTLYLHDDFKNECKTAKNILSKRNIQIKNKFSY